MTNLFHNIDQLLDRITRVATNLCLLIIVLVVLYNVVMRYGFDAPPFWSDRIGVFANIAMILFGLSLTVRNRDLIAMQALYEKVSPKFALILDGTWNLMILVFSLIFAWFGLEAAINMPGQYWDFQNFCIDLGFEDDETRGFVFQALKSVESLVGLAVKPFCVDGAVPQKYLAMLMPISGVLLVMSSLGVLLQDFRSYQRLDDHHSGDAGDKTETS